MLMRMWGDQKRRYLTDVDLRQAVHAEIVPTLAGNSPTRILDEMAICAGEARVDIAVINGRLHGFEIKSEADTLARLEQQTAAYNRVFDTMTIVCGENHFASVESSVPAWWGIYTAKLSEGKVKLSGLRQSGMNNNVDNFSLAQLLWKSELVQLLLGAGINKGISRKPCRELWGMVAESYPTCELQSNVRKILSIRANWRPDLQQT